MCDHCSVCWGTAASQHLHNGNRERWGKTSPDFRDLACSPLLSLYSQQYHPGCSSLQLFMRKRSILQFIVLQKIYILHLSRTTYNECLQKEFMLHLSRTTYKECLQKVYLLHLSRRVFTKVYILHLSRTIYKELYKKNSCYIYLELLIKSVYKKYTFYIYLEECLQKYTFYIYLELLIKSVYKKVFMLHLYLSTTSYKELYKKYSGITIIWLLLKGMHHASI